MADGGAKNKVFKKASFEEAATEGSFFAFKFFSLFLEKPVFPVFGKKRIYLIGLDVTRRHRDWFWTARNFIPHSFQARKEKVEEEEEEEV